jgi:hypothetical protein
MLNTKYFGSSHPIEVSDADVVKFYEENKESMPELLISRGGVKAAGVQFDKEVDAKAFATKAKGKDIATVAKAEKIANDRVRDFNFVNDQSVGVNPAVRSKVVSLKKFPATEVVKGDEKTWWVVNATESQEAKYRPFEQVQAGLKQYVEKERRMAMFDKEIGTLKDKYAVKINDDFFKQQQQNLALDEELAENAETIQAAVAAQPNDNARAA